MEDIRADKLSPLARKAFLRLLPIQIIEVVVFAINTFIDSVITSRFLGTDGMAAIGLFVPVAMVIGVTDTVIFGSQILCGRYIGSGDRDKVVSLFSTGVVFLGAVGILLSLACLLFSRPLSIFLGAEGPLLGLLTDYITGYAPGIIGQVLVGMFLIFLPYNNDIKRCYAGIGVMVASNTIMDILLVGVWKIGIIGMGIATAGSYLLACALMLPGFLSGTKTVYLRFSGLCMRRLPEAVRLGLPSLMMVIGGAARGYVMNRTLMISVGAAAVAAMTVQSNVCAIMGAIPLGTANAFLTMGSIFYGEEDRPSLVRLFRFSLCFGAMLAAAAMALLMLFSGTISNFFFSPAEEAWEVTRRMLLLFPAFLVFNVIFSLLLKAYQLQEKTGLVNALSVAEPLIMVFLAVGMTGIIGSDAVWLSFPFSEIICILIIAISVMLHAGKLTFSLSDWMKLDRDFGVPAEACMEFSVHSIEQVLRISIRVIDFCLERGIDGRRSKIAGLCVEEMVGNVVEHGFRLGETHHVEVRLVAKESLIICVRDDCRAFDPKSRMEQFDPEDVTKNIGIRMIANMTEEMNYQCTAGINTLQIRV